MADAVRDEVDLNVLLRDWSLTKGDLREIERARGQGRLWTALYLCSLPLQLHILFHMRPLCGSLVGAPPQ
jgi:hypothetical protein